MKKTITVLSILIATILLFVMTTCFSGVFSVRQYEEGCAKQAWGYPITYITDVSQGYSISVNDNIDFEKAIVNILLHFVFCLNIFFLIKFRFKILGRKKFFAPKNVGILTAMFGSIVFLWFMTGLWGGLFKGDCPRQMTVYERRLTMIVLSSIIVVATVVFYFVYFYLYRFFTNKK